MRLFSRALSIVLICATPLFLRAQESPAPPQTSTLSVNVRIVAFDALVRNGQGELVHHLTRDDFFLTEDGKPQPIRYFNEDTDLPLTIGLMVDTSGSQRTFFSEQQVASTTFLTNMLTRPQDNAFVLRFDNNVLLMQRMTSNLPALEDALGKLPLIYPPRPGPLAGTLLFDALCGTAHNAFPTNPGRRAVVMLTDGEDNGSTKTRDQAIACAQLANIIVYTALYTTRDEFTDERFDPRVHVYEHEHLPGRTNMERISRSTGGRVFIVSKKLPIEKIYAQIQEDLRSQYRLGYTPPPSKPGSYHQLELKTADRHAKIQTRIGYYTPQ